MTMVLVCFHDPCLFVCFVSLFDRTLEGWALSLFFFLGFRPQGKLFFCSQGFVPQEKLFFGPWGFVPQGNLGWPMLLLSPANCSSGFRPPREAGAASLLSRSPEGEVLPFVPGVLSPRGSSSSFLGVSSPKVSWGSVDAALASGCRTAVARRWAIRLFVADKAVRP